MNQPKRIIIVTDYAWVIGGASKVAMQSAVALAERGYDTYHFSAVGPVAKELAAAPVNVCCLSQPSVLDEPNRFVGAQKGLWNREAARAFARLLSTVSPDDTIVHFHQWTKALSPSIFRPVLDQRFRFVVTLHDYFMACPNGGFLDYPTTEICTRKPLTAGCVVCDCDPRNYAHKLWRVARQLIQNRLLLASAGLTDVIYVSEFSRAVLAPHLPAQLNWYFVPNPIQAERTPRIRVAKNRAYVFVGRLSKEKGGCIFARAARRAGVPAIFIGDGEERQQIMEANPDAEITGWVKPGEVYARLSNARALIFPSIWYEMQGLTVAEAASMGVPSIVGDRSAARDWVSDGETGLHMRGTSDDDLTAKLVMLQDDTVLERMSIATYDAFWRNPPDVENHVNHLEETYRAVFSAERN
ncbi:MAG: glycosyltransferase family 4 protein [Rhodospirillales bacterium]|nr:glycosyltransferase family 4 protein [Rhodospirillales bacterium]